MSENSTETPKPDIKKRAPRKMFFNRPTRNTIPYRTFRKFWNRLSREEDKHILTLLFFTGCSVQELPNIRSADLTRDETRVWVALKGSKKQTRPRDWPLYLRYETVRALWDYAGRFLPQEYIFPSMRLAGCKTNLVKRFRYSRIPPPLYFTYNRMEVLFNNNAPYNVVLYLRGSTHINSISRHLKPRPVNKKKLGRYLL